MLFWTASLKGFTLHTRLNLTIWDLRRPGTLDKPLGCLPFLFPVIGDDGRQFCGNNQTNPKALKLEHWSFSKPSSSPKYIYISLMILGWNLQREEQQTWIPRSASGPEGWFGWNVACRPEIMAYIEWLRTTAWSIEQIFRNSINVGWTPERRIPLLITLRNRTWSSRG